MRAPIQRLGVLFCLCSLFLACGEGGTKPGDGVPAGCQDQCANQECGTVGDCTCGVCPDGFVCGNDFLCVSEAEAQTCLDACTAAQWSCGEVEDGCTCGNCQEGDECDKGACVPASDCQATCDGLECGTVGECDCGSCTDLQVCQGNLCVDQDPACTADCAAVECGMVGECDCGGCEDGFECLEGQCQPEGDPCDSVCQTVQCGLTGDCDCGDCETGFSCVNSACVADSDPCVGVCQSVDCGMKDDCDCGGCDQGFKCSANLCVEKPDECIELCGSKECGFVGSCDCGDCPAGFQCNDNTLTCDCLPVCNDPGTGVAFECGDDGCGDACSTCDYGTCVQNFCYCDPQCTGKDCGPDGCGDECGDCPFGYSCGADFQCVLCLPGQMTFAEDVTKINMMAIGDGGHPGQALDIDHNTASCAPVGDCVQGLDNQLSGLFGQLTTFGVDVDAELAAALDSGQIMMLFEHKGIATDGTVFQINFYLADPVEPAYLCDFQLQSCDYEVDAASLDLQTCSALIYFDNAKIVNGKLTAGGTDYELTISLPLFEGAPMDITLFMAHIEGDFVGTPGGAIGIDNGILAGAVSKQLLLDTIEALPDSVFPIDKGTVIMLLNMLVSSDMDTDGDSVKDSASLGIRFKAIDANITGMGL